MSTITKIQRGNTTLNVRAFDYGDSDYERIVAIHNAGWPEYASTVAAWKHDDKHRDEKYIFVRLMVEQEGEVVAFGAYGEPAWSYKPGKFFINVLVHPDHQAHGVGAAFYDHVMECLNGHDPAQITANVREDRTRGVHFLEDRGFQLKMRFPTSKLDVDAFDVDQYADLDEALARHGIEIRTLTELRAQDPKAVRKLYELGCEVLKDVPSVDPITPETYEQYEKRVMGNPDLLPDANFIAMDGNQYVGYSALWRHEKNPKQLDTGLTGVVRGHRRKGVCTALKVRGIRFAQQYGAKEIETENEENNPMYQLNLALGFVPQPAWTNYVKQLKPESGDGEG